MKDVNTLFFRGRSSWLIPLILLVLTILLFEVFPWDVTIQDLFYSAESGWIIKFHKHSGFGWYYYTLPKILLAKFGIILLAIILWQFFKHNILKWRLLYIILCMSLIPGIVGTMKNIGNMPYPCKTERYGGQYELRNLTQAIFNGPLPDGKKFHGWPGGHASGGYGLMGLAFVSEDKKKRWLGFALATATGTFMGLCHTMDGNHFFSHNLVSFCVAWLTAALLFSLMDKYLSNESTGRTRINQTQKCGFCRQHS